MLREKVSNMVLVGLSLAVILSLPLKTVMLQSKAKHQLLRSPLYITVCIFSILTKYKLQLCVLAGKQEERGKKP